MLVSPQPIMLSTKQSRILALRAKGNALVVENNRLIATQPGQGVTSGDLVSGISYMTDQINSTFQHGLETITTQLALTEAKHVARLSTEKDVETLNQQIVALVATNLRLQEELNKAESRLHQLHGIEFDLGQYIAKWNNCHCPYENHGFCRFRFTRCCYNHRLIGDSEIAEYKRSAQAASAAKFGKRNSHSSTPSDSL